MKRFFLSGLVVMAMLATSCERFLDVRQPDIIPYDRALDRIDNAEALTRAMYNDFQGIDNFKVAHTMLGDEVNLERQQQDQFGADYLTGNFGPFNGIGENLWGTGYRAIHKSNQLIEAFEKNQYNASEPVRNRLGGEAYFIRGYMHFELCRTFALPYSAGANRPGIVIRNKGSVFAADEVNNKLGRSTVGESYQQAINDLTRAIELLPENAAFGRFSKNAARAALARVYFNMDVVGNTDNYQRAVALCNDIIGSGRYKMTQPLAAWRKTGIVRADSSVVYDLVNTLSDNTGGALAGSFWADGANNVFTPIRTGSGQLFNLLRDFGGSRYDSLVLAPNSGRPYTQKYVGNAQPFFNLPIFRYAEVLLTRAEANITAGGNITQSLDDVNQVRAAANLPALQTTNPTALIDSIRLERRLELHLEGDRYHELRRTRQLIRGNAYDDSKKFFQIPLSESRANPGIELN